MFETQITQIKYDPIIIAKYQKIVLKSNKQRDWIKLLNCYHDNNDLTNIKQILNKIHKRFIMQQSFWLNQFTLLNKCQPQIQIDIIFIGLNDGFYFQLAKQICKQIIKSVKNIKLRYKYGVAKLQQLIQFFNHDLNHGGYFYQKLRQIYQQLNAIQNIRQLYSRQIKCHFNNVDVIYDEYKNWQKGNQNCQKYIESMQKIYQNATMEWQKETLAQQSQNMNGMNIKNSLLLLENTPGAFYNDKYLQLLDKLPTQTQRLWFLRRIAFERFELQRQFLLKYQIIHNQDYQQIDNQYKVMSDKHQYCQILYLQYLVRNITLHYHNSQSQQYNNNWGTKVQYFRNLIIQFIQKKRINQQQQLKFADMYYQYWLEVQIRVVRDKQSIIELFQNRLKQIQTIELYKKYSQVLIQFSQYKKAKNILKKLCSFEKYSQNSLTYYRKFLTIYGNIEDLQEFYKLQRNNCKQFKFQQIYGGGEKKRNKQYSQSQQSLEKKISTLQKRRFHTDSGQTVFLENIPKTWRQSQILQILTQPNQVQQIRIVPKSNNKQFNNCYIQYKSKQFAQLQCANNNSGYTIEISKPFNQYDQTKTIFLCSLPQNTTVDDIKVLLSQYYQHLMSIRIKINKQKSLAYVDIDTTEKKNQILQRYTKQKLILNGKKIIIQQCDSDRIRSKKFVKVIFIKNLSFKARQDDLIKYFSPREIVKVVIPRDNKKSKGFAYVEFQKFKDYQEVLDMQTGELHGRKFSIFKSDRQITQEKRDKLSTQKEPIPQKNNQYFRSLFK